MVLKATISATSEAEADRLSRDLVERRLLAGTFVTSGDSRYWWNGQVCEATYYNVEGYTTRRHREQIIGVVEGESDDDVPIVEFVEVDGSRVFRDWVAGAVG